MSEIAQLNEYTPTNFHKMTEEYLAIFGNEDFTPNDPIVTSSDFNCGAIANELEYVKGFCDYLTRSNTIDDFSDVYLDRIVKFFIGLKRKLGQTDEFIRLLFRALCIRHVNDSWCAKWILIDVFSYFFPEETLWIMENYVEDDLLTDGSFEIGGYWTEYESGSSTVDINSNEVFEHTFAAEFTVDNVGSICYLQQTMSSVPQGNYMLSFFRKDDDTVDSPFKVYITRSSDGYYYEFDSFTWQAASTYLLIDKTNSTRFESISRFVKVVGTDDITIRFESNDAYSVQYNFWIDKVCFGTKLPYPTIKLLIQTEDAPVEFMSLWPDGADPLGGGEDYDIASYYDDCYFFGGVGYLGSYSELLYIIKTAGVKAVIEVVLLETI